MDEKYQVENTIRNCVRQIENSIGIREGFLSSIRDEDDWSFVIKLHALFEAGISHLLCQTIGKEELSGVFAHLELSDKRAGKLAFVKALSLLSDADRRFISALSELRNKLVHDVRNAQFDLQAHVKSLSHDQIKSFTKNFNSYSTEGALELDGKTIPPSDVFLHDPKTGIFWSAMVTLAVIYMIGETKQLKQQAKHQYALLYKRLQANLEPEE
jgi:hypothetical protein